MYNAMKWTEAKKRELAEAKKRELAAAKRRTHYAEDIQVVIVRSLDGTGLHVANPEGIIDLSYSLVPMYLREYNHTRRGYGVNSPSFTTWVAEYKTESFTKEAKRLGIITERI